MINNGIQNNKIIPAKKIITIITPKLFNVLNVFIFQLFSNITNH